MRAGIDTQVGRAEADKERVVCEMEKEINLTLERKSVGSVVRDDGVTCSGNGESRYPDAQGTQDGRQTRRDIMVEHSWETSVTAIWLPRIFF